VASSTGTLALVGGAEWSEGCSFDESLLAASGGTDVLVLPTASAYERPERLVVAAAEWFASLGAAVEGLMVLTRADAADADAATVVRRARFVYLSGGSALHLRSVLKGSAVLGALREAWQNGAVVAGAGAGAMALTDPMVDPRGGALTVGLGLIEGLAVFTHYGDVAEDAHGEKLHRSVALAPEGLPVVGLPERTALLRDPSGRWSASGIGQPTVFVDGERAADGVGRLNDLGV
jgi:cyanophycinase